MSQEQLTDILKQVRRGEPSAHERLWPLVYRELRRIAARQLRREKPGHTLAPTALVHEAYLKLAGGEPLAWEDRAHFFGVAARAMREILVDYARRRRAAKRGGDRVRTTLGDKGIGVELSLEEILAFDEALGRLEELDPRLRRIVELRFFGGLSDGEIAAVLGISDRTVQRDWVKARAWLYKELYPS